MKKIRLFICLSFIFLLIGCQSNADKELFNALKKAQSVSSTLDGYPSDNFTDYSFEYEYENEVHTYYISKSNNAIFVTYSMKGYKFFSEFKIAKKEHPHTYKQLETLLDSDEHISKIVEE